MPKDRREKDPLWAWVALIGIAFTQVLLNGSIRAFGILYVELLDVFDKGPFITSWIQALYGLTLIIASPVAAVLHAYVSTRWTVIACSIIGMAALVGSSQAHNIYVVIVTYGFIYSFCAGVTFNAVMVSCNTYFVHRRALANGIALAGASVGGMLLPFLYQHLILLYTVRGTLIIFGGLWLNLCVVGGLFRPFSEICSNGQKRSETNFEDVELDTVEKTHSTDVHIMSMTKRPQFARFCNGPLSKIRRSPFFSIRYITLLFFWFCQILSIYSIMLDIPPYTDELHYTKPQTATLLTFLGATDLVSRVFLGFIGDFKKVNTALLISAILLVHSIISLFVPLMDHFWQLVLYCVLTGLACSSGVYLGPFVVEAVGISNVAAGIGFMSVTFGTANAVGPLTIGGMREATGTFQHQFVLGAVSLLIGIFVFCVLGQRLPIVQCYHKFLQRKRNITS